MWFGACSGALCVKMRKSESAWSVCWKFDSINERMMKCRSPQTQPNRCIWYDKFEMPKIRLKNFHIPLENNSHPNQCVLPLGQHFLLWNFRNEKINQKILNDVHFIMLYTLHKHTVNTCFQILSIFVRQFGRFHHLVLIISGTLALFVVIMYLGTTRTATKCTNAINFVCVPAF